MSYRSTKDDQDLVLVTLLALDQTGHAMAPGSVGDLATLTSTAAIESLRGAGLTRTTKGGALELTDAGREEARAVAGKLAGRPMR